MTEELPGDPRDGSGTGAPPAAGSGESARVEPGFDVHRDAHDAPRARGSASGSGAPSAAPSPGSWANTQWAPQPEAAPPMPPATPPQVVVVRRGRPFWAWWLLTSLVVSVICVIVLVTAMGHIGDQPLHVIVDGEEVGTGFNITLGALPVAHKVALISAAVLAIVVLMLVVPLVIVVVLAAVLLALVAGVGLPLIAAVVVLLVVTSPLWLVVGLVWMVIRANRRASAIAAAATGNGSATIRA
jgi:hypothetical protein